MEDINQVLEAYNKLNLSTKKSELFNLVDKVSNATGELLKIYGARPIFKTEPVANVSSLEEETYMNELFKKFLLMENNLLFLFELEKSKQE